LQHGEVARILNCMTLHSEGLKAEVGVRELHDQLSRYLRHVGSGGDVVVTMRGRRVARLSGLDAGDPLADLRARGLVRDPQQIRRRTSGHSRLTVTGTVSDLVSEQRR
jgi:prevent-host-death family protein